MAAPASSPLPRLVGVSAAMHRLEEAIARVGHVDCPVLLTGETGSGKDEAARAIHAAGSRAAGPFVAVNCAGIVGTLAESLLFGHEKGSFTGADEATTGAFRAAIEQQASVTVVEAGRRTDHQISRLAASAGTVTFAAPGTARRRFGVDNARQ